MAMRPAGYRPTKARTRNTSMCFKGKIFQDSNRLEGLRSNGMRKLSGELVSGAPQCGWLQLTDLLRKRLESTG